jgi:hypothetical protein
MVVPQFPVRLRQPFKPFSRATRPDERDSGDGKGGDRQQPVKGQQKPYLIERLATVSTACDNTPVPAVKCFDLNESKAQNRPHRRRR